MLNIDTIMRTSSIMVTPEEYAAAGTFVIAMSEAIRQAKRIPSGTLYAMVSDRCGLATYNSVIDLLKRTKLVREQHHELIWMGPEIPR